MIVSHQDWLAACTDRDHRFVVERFGRSRVARGWKLQQRTVRQHYCFMMLDRSGLVAVGDEHLRLGPDSCVWIAPGIAHTVIPDDPMHPFRFFHWRFQILDGDRDLRCAADAILCSQAGHLRPLFESAWAEWQADLPLREQRLRCLLAAITGDLLRGQQHQSHLSEHQRRALLDHIHRRLPSPILPAELATALGLSHDYATRLIRQSFGCPPRELVLRERIRLATEDLSSSDLPIGRIASRWGFDDQRYFARQFKRFTGKTPTRFRSDQHR